MQYRTICSITTIIAAATASPLGIPLGNGRFVYPEGTNSFGVPLTNKQATIDRRLVITADELSQLSKNPLGIGPQTSLTFGEEKRSPVEVGEFDDHRKQGLSFFPTGSNPGFWGPKEVRDAEPIVAIPGFTDNINPPDCDDPLICASLKEREAEPIVAIPGLTDNINPPDCDSPWCTSLKERDAEPIMIVPGFNDNIEPPPGCDGPLCPIMGKRDAEAQDAIPIVFLSQEEKRDLAERDPKGGQNTASIIGGLTSAAGLVGLQSLFSGNEKRDAEAQDAIPVIFLSQEEKRELAAREAKGGQNTASIIGGLTSAAGLVGLQSLFSGNEKRDADGQDVLPVIFLSEEEKRDLIARDPKGGANTAAVIGGLTGSAALVTLQNIFAGNEKRDAEAQDLIPVVFLPQQEEKRDLIARDAKGGANTAAVIGGLTGSAALVTLQNLFSGEKRDAEAVPEPFMLAPGEEAPAACTADIPGIVCLKFKA